MKLTTVAIFATALVLAWLAYDKRKTDVPPATAARQAELLSEALTAMGRIEQSVARFQRQHPGVAPSRQTLDVAVDSLRSPTITAVDFSAGRITVELHGFPNVPRAWLRAHQPAQDTMWHCTSNIPGIAQFETRFALQNKCEYASE